MIDIFAKPLGALLKWIYDLCVNTGLDSERLSAYSLSIVITTIVFKFILLPLTLKSTKSMQGMQEIQPKMQEIQKKYKGNPEKVNEETMKLYKEYNVSPFGGCLPMLIQFPILLAYFNVMREPVKYVFGSKEAFDSINRGFLWIIDIAKTPTAVIGGQVNDVQIAGVVVPVIAILSAITTFFYSKYSMNMQQPSTASSEAANQAQVTQKMMMYMMPLMFLFFGYTYPVGFTIYWTVSNIFAIVQQLIIKKVMAKPADKDEIALSKVKDNKKK